MEFYFRTSKDLEKLEHLEELEKKVSYWEKSFRRFMYLSEKINYIPETDTYIVFPNKYFKFYIEVSNKDIGYPIVKEVSEQRREQNDGE